MFTANYSCPKCGVNDSWYHPQDPIYGAGYEDTTYVRCANCDSFYPTGIFIYRCWFQLEEYKAGYEVWGWVDGEKRIVNSYVHRHSNAVSVGNRWKDTQIAQDPDLKGMRHWQGDRLYKIQSTHIANGQVSLTTRAWLQEEARGIIGGVEKRCKAKKLPKKYKYELVFAGLYLVDWFPPNYVKEKNEKEESQE